MEINDRFADGLVYQEGGGKLKVPSLEDSRDVTPCLLCGNKVEVNKYGLGIVVCEDCKKLWKRLKEKTDD